MTIQLQHFLMMISRKISQICPRKNCDGFTIIERSVIFQPFDGKNDQVFQSIAVISQLSNIPLKKNYQINGSIGLQNGTNDTNTSLISRATLIARPQQEPRPMSSKLYKKIAQFRRQMANGSM